MVVMVVMAMVVMMVVMVVMAMVVMMEGFLLLTIHQHPDMGSGDSLGAGSLRPDGNAGNSQAV